MSVSPGQLLDTKTKIFTQLVESQLNGIPGVVESIIPFHTAGLRIAIGTSLHAKYIRLVLDRIGVRSYFETTVTGDEIKNGKPHPETYLTLPTGWGCQQIHVSCSRTPNPA